MHRPLTKRRRTRLAAAAGAAAIAATVLAALPGTAAAGHFTGTVKTCEPQDPVTGTFDCLLNINVLLVPNQTVVLRIQSGETGAEFEVAPTRIGGTCPATGTITLADTGRVQFGSGTAPQQRCTIVLQETLEADAFGEVCQTLEYASGIHFPIVPVCAELLPPPLPTTTEACKNGLWRAYLVFKNQGDCVSFVATDGRNEPGKNE
jgi:hypothetical protein